MTKTINKPLRTILCPVDFSPSSEKALLHAAGQYSADSELIILHIDYPGSGDRGTLLKEHLHHFSRYSDILSEYGCKVRFAVEYGTPAEAIILFAEKYGTDLIVMGSHGSSNILRLLVGSTAEKVMRNAPCPVMILKSPESVETADEAVYENIELLSNTND
ncbi:MAG: universal stress protein [Chlorobiaceae bacterium]|nr:universal stress protein [Chlorobiaceae bacterium]